MISRLLKKTTFVVALLLATATQLSAQMRVGVKGGGSLNNMFLAQDTNHALTPSSIFGFSAGVSAEYFFNERMSAGIEALFAMQGCRRTWRDRYDHPGVVPTKQRATVQTFHLNIPVLFRYHFGGFAIEAGPQVSICFGGRHKHHIDQSIGGEEMVFDTVYHFSDLEMEISDNINVKEYKVWNRVTFGAAAGIRYTFEGGFNVGLRYAIDLSNDFNHWYYESDEGDKVLWESYKSRHSVFSISIGIVF